MEIRKYEGRLKSSKVKVYIEAEAADFILLFHNILSTLNISKIAILKYSLISKESSLD